jgi:catechol 2,3-dioxygenase-like lactoylglutathione lyase family enzyme
MPGGTYPPGVPDDAAAPPPRPALIGLTIADEAETWAAAGFAVDDDGTSRLGGIRVTCAGSAAGRAVTALTFRDLASGAPADLDGMPVVAREAAPADPAAHPNTATAIDHVVLLTDDLDRTIAAAEALGLVLRRRRDGDAGSGQPVRQAFFRAGEAVLEVVAPAEPRPEPRAGVRSFGLAVVATDLDAAGRLLGEGLGAPKRAVQEGRLIATVRARVVGLGTPVALMTPGRH